MKNDVNRSTDSYVSSSMGKFHCALDDVINAIKNDKLPSTATNTIAVVTHRTVVVCVANARTETVGQTATEQVEDGR